MGFAIAAAAAAAGARVCLVAGPVHLATPPGVVQRIDVRSAQQMRDAVLAQAPDSDIYLGAAAVGDYRPGSVAAHKMKKRNGEPLVLELTENPDILAELAGLDARPFLVGFAAETRDVEHYAREKLVRKKLDMVAANQVGPGLGFDAEDNALTLIWDQGRETLPRAGKRELAQALIERVAAHFKALRGQPSA
jgi:phosphopantothenoylcysteine decarboxylase/phosphopantothenate--cysteine ligase